MKSKILSIGIILILGVMLITLTGCGGNNNSKSYSEMINVIRENTTSAGLKMGDILDSAIEKQDWTEEKKSVYITEVKLTGKDKQTGDSIEFLWEITSPGGDNHNYSCKSFLRNGEEKGILTAGAYIREYESKLKEQN